MNKYLDLIINFDVDKAVKDYGNFLSTEDGETVLNNIILNYSENIGNICRQAPKEMSEVELTKLLRLYSSNMLKLWDQLKKIHAESVFEFNMDNPFQTELEKTDAYLAKILF